MSKSTSTNFFIVLAVIIVVLLGYYFVSGSATTNSTDITVSLDDHIRANKNATVTLVEFGDFQCPACGAYEPIVAKAVAENAQDIRFVFRHFPLTQIHQNALLAAKYSEAASIQGKFWEMHDVLYKNQSEWSGSPTAKVLFEGYAKTLGLDVVKLSSDAQLKDIESKILAQYREGIKLGIQGTPTFFLNGKKLDPAPRTPEDFKAAFQKAKKEATTSATTTN